MKNNLGPDATGLGFRIEGATISSPAGPLATSRVSWDSEPVSMTADEAMQTEGASSVTSALTGAIEWLRETLAHGPMAAPEVFDRAKAEDIAKRTLQRASKALDVRKEKLAMVAGWSWSLPPKVAKSGEDVQNSDVATFGEVGHLREAESTVEIEL
jgi:putative DNA primase/helicase